MEPAIRREIWKILHGIGFHTMEVEGEFLHLGTTRQFRDAMTGRSSSPAAELFQQNILAYSQWKLPAGRRVFHSALLHDGETSGQIGEGSVIEHSILRAPGRIGANCVVSQTVALDQPLNLPDDLLFFQVPVRLRDQLLFVQLLCGTADDFKGAFAAGKCLYLNRPIEHLLTRHGINPNQIWSGIPREKRTLWNARLFPATAVRDASNQATWLAQPHRASKTTLTKWLKTPRFSMAMILESADPQALIEHREVVAAYLQAGQIIERIRLRE